MSKIICNPYLPLDVCMPDGEPHVFGDRVYMYCSHDQEDGKAFCLLDYEFYSAPVDDLTNWTKKGVSYSPKWDPDYGEEYKALYAPDCVRGNDGRFYLYYSMAGGKHFTGPMHVAVSDYPDGPFEYIGPVRYPDGRTYDANITFDPGVINDDGVIRLYYGWSLAVPKEMAAGMAAMQAKDGKLPEQLQQVCCMMFEKTPEQVNVPGGIMGANTVELEDDMMTIKEGTDSRIVPGQFDSIGTEWEDHSFFEASSIRKIGDTYYFIYSSEQQHEMCYATSKYPDRDFHFRGTIVSNGDIGIDGRPLEKRLATTGNDHGSIECINGQWYIFYHRQTHKTSFSRQGCAEPIEIAEDGSIKQVEMTSQGLNGGPLPAEGTYPAPICCVLTDGHMKHQNDREPAPENYPFITNKGEERFVADVTSGTIVGYRYFDFTGEAKLTIKTRGSGRGTVEVYTKLPEDEAADQLTPAASITVRPDDGWYETGADLRLSGKQALYLKYSGEGMIDILTISFD